ncbi:MAG: hypothetical protein NC200_08150 [Candidatus Gastranaerophilales bacterium]|nr:hypothetical protein [Candidatus Gastranaerophilales bacterium]
MGLASSQARLLTLTSRMHQIEYKAAKLEAQKLQMANESARVYEDYLDALEATKVQYKYITTDGSVAYQDINHYEDFITAGYAIDYKGVIYDGTAGYRDDKGNGINVTALTADEAQAALGADYDAAKTYYKFVSGDLSGYVTADELAKATPAGADITTTAGATINVKTVTNNYAQLCADAFGADINNPPANVSEVITNLINTGDVTLVQRRNDNTFAQETDIDFAQYETSVATNTGLRENPDEVELKKAEAKYEADMKKIDMKDRKFDQELAAMETERNAIKQEMETLKTVAKDNVERTFKLFG